MVNVLSWLGQRLWSMFCLGSDSGCGQCFVLARTAVVVNVLAELQSQFDPFIARHIERHRDRVGDRVRDRVRVAAIVATICDEFITIMGQYVLGHVVIEPKSAKYA